MSRKIAILACPLCLISGSVSTADWSEATKIFDERQIIIAYRAQETADGWLVEWQAVNGGNFPIEPILHTRTYTCTNGAQQTRDRESLGPIAPAEQRSSLQDRAICAGSTIHTVVIAPEIAPARRVARASGP